MCTRLSDAPDGVLDIRDGRMQAAQAKWARLTSSDLGAIRNKQDLIMAVEACYSLTHQIAVQDVEIWDAAVRGGADPGAMRSR